MERKTARASDMIYVGGLFGEEGRRVKGGTDRNHQLETVRHCCEGCGCGPSVQRGRIGTFDIVEV